MARAETTRADALDAEAIAAGLAARGESLDVRVLERCGSTNSELLALAGTERPAVLLADEQTAGRGRRGRRWHASPGSALMFSLRWAFAGDAGRLRGLSLAVGVSVAKTLRELGAQGVSLKWPNDLLVSMDPPGAGPGKEPGGAKLGGVLIETRAAAQSVSAVIGVGLNCRRMPGLETRLGRGIAALEDSIEALPSRNELAVRIVAGLAQALRVFGDAGFAAFSAEWESLHACQGAAMRVRTGDGRVIAGIAEGIAPDGSLRLRNRRGVRQIHSGTVLRGTLPRGTATRGTVLRGAAARREAA